MSAEVADTAETSMPLVSTPSAIEAGPCVHEAVTAAQVLPTQLADQNTAEAASNANIAVVSTGLGKRKVSKPGRFNSPPPVKR